MRIIAGKLGGQSFESPIGHRTHPMSDKVRGALFSSLGDVSGLTVLDAFAGSGALSFEAISRGARYATAIDIDTSAINAVVNSAEKLGIKKQVKAIRVNVSTWSDNNVETVYDLVLCDPPYDKIQIKLIQKLVRHIQSGGIMALSWPGKLEAPEVIGLRKIQTNIYGDAQLVYYRYYK
jgi:16S rRNA (guanine966-N2)-methyltransferase